jgi:hypothetical protein
MLKVSRWIILVLMVILGTSILLMAGCEGGKVTITIPPVTLTAPPVTLTATITPTTSVTTTITPVPGEVAAHITLSSLDDNNKIRTFHTLVATVTSENGTPLPGISVEWMLDRAPSCVGDIVTVAGLEPQKKDNAWAVAKTDNSGQVQLTITSTHEGDTYLMVYVPIISKANFQKEYTIIHWFVN